MICSIDDCDRKATRRGWCNKHCIPRSLAEFREYHRSLGRPAVDPQDTPMPSKEILDLAAEAVRSLLANRENPNLRPRETEPPAQQNPD